MEEIKEEKEIQKKLNKLPKNNMHAAIEQGIDVAIEAGFEFTKKNFLEYTSAHIVNNKVNN